MSESNMDVRTKAVEYRDHLKTELARVDDFINMAGQLADQPDDPDLAMMLLGAENLEAVVH